MAAAASAPASPSEDRPTCGAKKRAGGRCSLTPGWGTEHVGFGHCKLHAGSSPTGIVKAARLAAAAFALEYQVEPHEALLRAVGQAAKWELICRLKVDELDDSVLVVQHTTEKSVGIRVGAEEDEPGSGEVLGMAKVEVQTSTDARLNIWVKAHTTAVRDLASIAKTAIDAGVEERRVRVAEQLGAQLGDLLAAIVNDLDLSDAQRKRAPAIVRRHLIALEGGTGVAA